MQTVQSETEDDEVRDVRKGTIKITENSSEGLSQDRRQTRSPNNNSKLLSVELSKKKRIFPNTAN